MSEPVAGKGAKTIGQFSLQSGDVLRILVGQSPYGTAVDGQAGGGGSFVTKEVLASSYQMQDGTYIEPLVVAGGGCGKPGGGNYYDGVDGRTSTRGHDHRAAGHEPSTIHLDFKRRGGGGGGSFSVHGRGYTSFSQSGWRPGFSFLTGGRGGAGWSKIQYGGDGEAGGFGGGAGMGAGSSQAAGGGGFDGGDYYHPGTTNENDKTSGGGSYNTGTNQDNEEGIKQGPGLVQIACITPGSEATYTFTNCGKYRNIGPTQAECNAEYAGTNLEGEVTILTLYIPHHTYDPEPAEGIQQWTAPTTGDYVITAYGAQGGGDSDNMGDRYWIGGTGDWDNIANWSGVSGGTGGASVPDQHNNVILDANSFSSNGQTITVPDGSSCAGLRARDLSHEASINIPYGCHLNVYNNVFLHEKLTIADTTYNEIRVHPKEEGGVTYFSQSGASLGLNITFQGNANITNHRFELGSDLHIPTYGRGINIESHFDTANHNIKVGNIDVFGDVVSDTKIFLRSSTVTVGKAFTMRTDAILDAANSNIIFDSEDYTNPYYPSAPAGEALLYVYNISPYNQVNFNRVEIKKRAEGNVYSELKCIDSPKSGVNFSVFKAELNSMTANGATEKDKLSIEIDEGFWRFGAFEVTGGGELSCDGWLIVFTPRIRGVSSTEKLRIANNLTDFIMEKG